MRTSIDGNNKFTTAHGPLYLGSGVTGGLSMYRAPVRSQVRDSTGAPAAEIGDALADEPPDPALTSIERLRLVVLSVGISLLVFSQSSGLVAADTKLDLVVSPARFLSRAMNLWDPIGGSGQLQDQAYGYLFPMGPFYLLGHGLDLPAWIIQRGWESLILVVAFLSARRLASLLGVRGFWSTVVAGLVYALAPRMLIEMFAISSELLPVAILPLVLIPLVRASASGPIRSAAMRSGAALLLAGGINASATLAILPVPAMWLITRSSGPRRTALMRWWSLAVILACLWWLVPLLLLGRYSPPFLDWIESSAVTMSQNSFVAVARGVDHWQGYLGANVWAAGWIFAVAPAAILATTAVAALGFGGLALRRIPHQFFLVATLVVGFVILTAGHHASLGSPAASSVQGLLDGPLSAFRNVHKFDPLVRLPLAIGAGHAVAPVGRFVNRQFRSRLASAPTWAGQYAVVAVAISIGAVALAPALGNKLVQLPRATVMASYWTQAADWLSSHADQGRALVLPGAGRPQMYWGSTVDEPRQAVASAPWASRETVPLGQAGYVRLLDAVESLVATGSPQPTLSPLLLRSGISYLVLRADLEPAADATPIGVVRSTVLNSPGLSVVRSFGPAMQATQAANRLVDDGATDNLPAIQIIRVGHGTARTSMETLGHAVIANGSADELPDLIRAGLQPGRPVLFGHDADGLRIADPERVLTDGLRKREVSFGHPGPIAATMTDRQPYQSARHVHDYLPEDPGPLSTMEYTGIADIRASSAGSDAAAFLNRAPDHAAWYAMDGDPATAWLSGSADGAVGQWLEIRFIAPITDPAVTIQFPPLGADTPTALRVETDAGSATVDVTPDSAPQVLHVPAGATQRLRLTVASVLSGTKGRAAGFAEVSVGGLSAGRALRVPAAPAADLITFRAAGYRSGCLAVRTSSTCIPRLAQRGEEQNQLSRVFTVGSAATYTPSASIVLTPSRELDDALNADISPHVDASSSDSNDPRQRPGAVVDKSTGTTWSAAADDPTPTLTLTWPRRVSLTGFTMYTSPDAPVSVPTDVRVEVDGRKWSLSVGDTGQVNLPESVTTSSLHIEIIKSAVRVSTDSVTGDTKILPTGVSDIRFPGVPSGGPAEDIFIPCGQGPTIDIDGTTVRTRVSASRTAVLAGAEVTATSCDGTVHLAEGEHRLTARPGIRAVPMGVTLSSNTRRSSPTVEVATNHVEKWGTTDRAVRVATQSESLLVVHENFNAGWRATLSGHRLKTVRVDGWEQAFAVPAGAVGVVHITYEPARAFDLGLLAGVLAVVVLLALAVRASSDTAPRGLVDGSLRRWALWLAAAAILCLVAGAAGLVVAALAAWLGTRGRWRPLASLPLLAGSAVLVAGVLSAIGPSVSSHALTDSPITQGLVLVALLLPLARVADGPSGSGAGESPPNGSTGAPAATRTEN